MRRLLSALAALTLFVVLPAPAFIYYSEQNMPLNGQDKNGQPAGLAVELLRLMWREMGEPEQPIHFLPWARGWYLLTQQQEAVLFTTARTKERDPHFLWVCPISHSRVALVGRKKDAPKVASKADLAKLQIGVMQADVGEQLLLSRGVSPSNMMAVERMDQVVRQLIMARTDLVAGNEVMLRYQAQNMGFGSENFVTVAILSEQENCFAFNLLADRQQVARLQQALQKVQQGKEYQALIARYQHVHAQPHVGTPPPLIE
ncbi:substrate-binding periplasmic protein [Aeromonas sobria]|uniref:substrate-binding periplasmic protein n=1 Tax=Aeromonas sobria TaxID=646 RepID=UPI0011199931|nr:transporter substrate-binding domain-containing protein [Aeromonas sobria]EKP0261013.1 transporter substrate-binding domain-containing protein [Aeromonas sobria]TNH94584.1 amino acid ABC transporter substrate-binding protein [Aeromonas sobria]TNJ24938.1 amino acid ABC transporter substrate-binding protein [Aeromonas sobria]HEH9416506.1 transporter substrate-binding domain-containing protein [Aeromonas sobria]HEH9440849.1 transporter substrate-binding domain-containing protein [Aeromonas sob